MIAARGMGDEPINPVSAPVKNARRFITLSPPVRGDRRDPEGPHPAKRGQSSQHQEPPLNLGRFKAPLYLDSEVKTLGQSLLHGPPPGPLRCERGSQQTRYQGKSAFARNARKLRLTRAFSKYCFRAVARCFAGSRGLAA